MHRYRPTIFSRLRRHRGLWFVCLATLLFKVFAASVCLGNDGLVKSGLAVATDQAASDTSRAASADAGCVLGEPGGCHCICSHSVPLPPIVDVADRVAIPTSLARPASAPHLPPAFIGSLFRPPIA